MDRALRTPAAPVAPTQVRTPWIIPRRERRKQPPFPNHPFLHAARKPPLLPLLPAGSTVRFSQEPAALFYASLRLDSVFSARSYARPALLLSNAFPLLPHRRARFVKRRPRGARIGHPRPRDSTALQWRTAIMRALPLRFSRFSFFLRPSLARDIFCFPGLSQSAIW